MESIDWSPQSNPPRTIPMCHHYRFLAEQHELRRAAAVASTDSQKNLPFGDFYPLSQVPVVRLNEKGERELVAMEWGLLPYWWKPSARRKGRKAFQRKCFNARCETIHEKPTFREAFKHRRCLIPATELFEKGHYLHLVGREVFMFAGLWERWEGESETAESCTIVTTTPNEAVQAVGHHRMPVVLASKDQCELWLGPEALESAEIQRLFVSLDSGVMESYRSL